MSGAGVAGASLLAGCERAGVLPDLPGNTPAADRNTNVVLIIMDSLRKEDLGTVEIPCGKVDCRSNCLEYLVSATGRRNDYTLAECNISALVSII